MLLSPSRVDTRIQGSHRPSLAGGTLLLAAGALFLAACGGGSSTHSATVAQPAGAPPAASSTTVASSRAASKPAGPTVVSVTTTRFGPILADARGMALYTASDDTASHSGCSGACLKYWPPLLLPAGESQPVAGPGISGLGTLVRSQGIQVTYHGKPLYTYLGDGHPGQVTGQGVVDSGGTWYVATRASAPGNPAAASPSTAPASTPPSTAPGGGVSY